MENSKSFESMDIDLSVNSTSAMDISDSFSEPQIRNLNLDEQCSIRCSPKRARGTSPVPCSTPKTDKNTNMKKQHINIKSKSKKTGIVNVAKKLSFLFIIFISVAIYHYKIQCYKELHLESLRNTLSTQIFGQAKAMESIVSALEDDKKYKILFFYGGTGVGKTYTSSLIMDNLGTSFNVYHYTMPTFVEAFPSDFMLGMIMCDSSLFIIDDLSVDVNVSEQINEIVDKSGNLKKNATIILIHNCPSVENMFYKKCDESLPSTLLNTYSNTHATHYFIKFESLTDSCLRKCVDRELGDMKIDSLTYEKIIKNFNVTSDGCKGVHNKVRLFNMI